MKHCCLPLLFVFTALALGGCNDKFATNGYGDVQGYGNHQVGMCSYLGGCMPDSE